MFIRCKLQRSFFLYIFAVVIFLRYRSIHNDICLKRWVAGAGKLDIAKLKNTFPCLCALFYSLCQQTRSMAEAYFIQVVFAEIPKVMSDK
jgi:hypothetical protein